MELVILKESLSPQVTWGFQWLLFLKEPGICLKCSRIISRVLEICSRTGWKDISVTGNTSLMYPKGSAFLPPIASVLPIGHKWPHGILWNFQYLMCMGVQQPWWPSNWDGGGGGQPDCRKVLPNFVLFTALIENYFTYIVHQRKWKGLIISWNSAILGPTFLCVWSRQSGRDRGWNVSP